MQSILLVNKWGPISKYCTNVNENHQVQPKTITEIFTESMIKVTNLRKQSKAQGSREYDGTKTLKPVDGYTSRFQYNGYAKKSHWHYYDENGPNKSRAPETELQLHYKRRKKHKYCLLMAFAGGNYFGMQYNVSVNTIEDRLLNAMVKNQWILEEHLEKPWLVEFQRGSRTDRGVSAARQNVSAILRELIFCLKNKMNLCFDTQINTPMDFPMFTFIQQIIHNSIFSNSN